MLLAALVVWVLAGPILKPVLIDLYVEYEAAQQQTLVGHAEDAQLEIPGTAADMGEDIVNILLEPPKIDEKSIDITIPVITSEPVVIKTQKISNTSKIAVTSANHKSISRLAETSKKPIENKEINKIPPFVSPYNIR